MPDVIGEIRIPSKEGAAFCCWLVNCYCFPLKIKKNLKILQNFEEKIKSN